METYKRCGRADCHCANGPGYGPKRCLSTVARTGERPRLGYVPNAAYPQVAEFLANYRKLQEMLNGPQTDAAHAGSSLKGECRGG